MRTLLPALCAAVLAALLALPHQLRAQGYYDPAPPDAPQGYLLAPDELDLLLAPIALYPDPLIAQILPAATFADQIDEAARYLRSYGSARIDYQPWDLSVRAVAHYPQLLFMMDQREDWSAAVGQAYLEQPQEVMDAIQRLRMRARAAGNLYSTGEQQVIYQAEVIRIVPARPQYIYLPLYDPQVVYLEPPEPGYSLVGFGAGLPIGVWLSRDCDWHRHRIYYHGWRQGGWVGRSRPHIRDRGHIYLNNRNAIPVRVNERVMRHDTRGLREEIRHEVERRRSRVEAPAAPPGELGAGRHREGAPPAATGAAPAPSAARPGRPAREGYRPTQRPARHQSGPATTRRPVTPRAEPAPTAPTRVTPAPAAGAGAGAPGPAAAPPQPAEPALPDVYRGRDLGRRHPASQSGFGGYGSAPETSRYRERGRTSRQIMRGLAPAEPIRPAPAPDRPAPAPPPATPQMGPATPGVIRGVPRAMPSVPNAAPTLPRATPSVPGAMPAVPRAMPSIPAPAPGAVPPSSGGAPGGVLRR